MQVMFETTNLKKGTSVKQVLDINYCIFFQSGFLGPANKVLAFHEMGLDDTYKNILLSRRKNIHLSAHLYFSTSGFQNIHA